MMGEDGIAKPDHESPYSEQPARGAYHEGYHAGWVHGHSAGATRVIWNLAVCAWWTFEWADDWDTAGCAYYWTAMHAMTALARVDARALAFCKAEGWRV